MAIVKFIFAIIIQYKLCIKGYFLALSVEYSFYDFSTEEEFLYGDNINRNYETRM